MMSEDLPAKPLPTLTKTASYHHQPNLAELPPDSTLTPVAKGYIEHYGQQKLVVESEDGQIYQAGMSMEQHKELLTEGCKIFLSNTKVLPRKETYRVQDCTAWRLDWRSQLPRRSVIACEEET